MTNDWNTDHSARAVRLIPGEDNVVIGTCARCSWEKNKLGLEVTNYIDITASVSDKDKLLAPLRKKVNELRRAKGLAYNADYIGYTVAVGVQPAKLTKDEKTIKTSPMQVVDMASAESIKTPDVIEQDVHAVQMERERTQRRMELRRRQEEEDKKRKEDSDISKMSDEQLKEILNKKPEGTERPKTVGGIGSLLDGPDDEE